MISLFISLLLLVGLLAASGTIGWRSLYYRLLARDLKQWQASGLITTQAADTILQQKRPKGLGQRLVVLVGFLGALLLLFSVVSFVAANWDEMSRLSRLTWLISLLWFAYIAGWRLVANGLPQLAEAAWLLGIGLFGVNIALIAQMFHIDSHPPAGVLMWSLGALISAAFLGSRTALMATFLGAITWSMMESIAYGVTLHWPFVLLWGAALAPALLWRWVFAYHFALLTFLIWLVTSLVNISMQFAWQPHGLLLLLVMVFLFLFVLSLVLQANEDEFEFDHFEVWLERYAVIGLLAATFALQTAKLKHLTEAPHSIIELFTGPFGWLHFALVLALTTLVILALIWREGLIGGSDFLVLGLIAVGTLSFALLGTSGVLDTNQHEFLATWIYGAAFLALLIWFMSFGQRQNADLYVWAALLAFAGEVLYIYARIFGSLLETSLFFFIGGLLTLLLALLLYRLRLGFEGEEQPMAPPPILRPKPKREALPTHHNPLQRIGR